MKYLVALLALSLCVACTDTAQMKTDGTREDNTKTCEDCVASSVKGPDTIRLTTCTARSTCVNNNASILNYIANTQCSASNSDVCTGKCPSPEKYSCGGIYDRPNSKGLSVTGNIVGACPRGLVKCDVTLTIPAAGTLACKCSCSER